MGRLPVLVALLGRLGLLHETEGDLETAAKMLSEARDHGALAAGLQLTALQRRLRDANVADASPAAATAAPILNAALLGAIPQSDAVDERTDEPDSASVPDSSAAPRLEQRTPSCARGSDRRRRAD